MVIIVIELVIAMLDAMFEGSLIGDA